MEIKYFKYELGNELEVSQGMWAWRSDVKFYVNWIGKRVLHVMDFLDWLLKFLKQIILLCVVPSLPFC